MKIALLFSTIMLWFGHILLVFALYKAVNINESAWVIYTLTVLFSCGLYALIKL